MRGRQERSICFCEYDGRFAKVSNREAVVCSGERVLGSFVSAEKERTVAGGLRPATQPS